MLSWSPPNNDEGPFNYRIEYDRGIGNWAEYATNVTVTWYYLADLDIGIVYSFRVQASNIYGYGEHSEEA